MAGFEVITEAVTTFARSCNVRIHLAHTDSRTAELSSFYRGVVGRFRHALTFTSPADVTKAGFLPSTELYCAPSQVLRTPRTPSRLRTTSASGLIPPVFARQGCRGGPLLFRIALSQRAAA